MKNNYVVRVLNLPEHERVILKLIFSVSEKSTLRINSYTLADDLHQPADVVMRDALIAYTATADVGRELLVMDAPATRIDAPVILRPLIATRVLAVLDDVFASVVIPFSAAQQHVAERVIAPDKTQEHPANFAAPGIPASQGADVAALIDAVLLSNNAAADSPLDLLVMPDETLVRTEMPEPVTRLKPRVLVVDDNPAVCKQLEIELRQFDVEVDYVPSARKAIEMIGKHTYQVAFLDVVLPDWDGFKICKHIKSKAPNTTVVMLSGQASVGDKLRGALAGCDAYLVKPVARQTFQATVKNRLALITNTQALG